MTMGVELGPEAAVRLIGGSGGFICCATISGGPDPRGSSDIVAMALSMATSASTWLRCFTAILAWMIKGIAGDGLVTTPDDDVTPAFSRKVSERSSSASAACH